MNSNESIAHNSTATTTKTTTSSFTTFSSLKITGSSPPCIAWPSTITNKAYETTSTLSTSPDEWDSTLSITSQQISTEKPTSITLVSHKTTNHLTASTHNILWNPFSTTTTTTTTSTSTSSGPLLQWDDTQKCFIQFYPPQTLDPGTSIYSTQIFIGTAIGAAVLLSLLVIIIAIIIIRHRRLLKQQHTFVNDYFTQRTSIGTSYVITEPYLSVEPEDNLSLNNDAFLESLENIPFPIKQNHSLGSNHSNHSNSNNNHNNNNNNNNNNDRNNETATHSIEILQPTAISIINNNINEFHNSLPNSPPDTLRSFSPHSPISPSGTTSTVTSGILLRDLRQFHDHQRRRRLSSSCFSSDEGISSNCTISSSMTRSTATSNDTGGGRPSLMFLQLDEVEEDLA